MCWLDLVKDLGGALVTKINGLPDRIYRQDGFVLLVLVLGLLLVLAGCGNDADCVNCVELPAPVVPTGVHSVSGNNMVTVQWYDISYAPYDGSYNPTVAKYNIYSRIFRPGDQFDPNREFFFIGEVAWDENVVPDAGLHWFDDWDAVNGEQYEYAVAAVNAANRESALSFELVTDAPLPMSPLDNQGWYTPIRISDANGADVAHSAFDFRRAALDPLRLNAGVVDPAQGFHIKLSIEAGIPYVIADNTSTMIQDFGVFSNGAGHLVFEGLSWAPDTGYSRTGRLEMVTGHIYAVRIVDLVNGELHYAKFGVDRLNAGSVDIIWAYQLIPGLDELSIPHDPGRPDTQSRLVRF